MTKSFDFFRETYSYCNAFNTAQFLICREAAVQQLAFLFVDHMRVKQQEYDKWIINSMKVCAHLFDPSKKKKKKRADIQFWIIE